MLSGFITLSAVAESPSAQCEQIISAIIRFCLFVVFQIIQEGYSMLKTYLKFGRCDFTSPQTTLSDREDRNNDSWLCHALTPLRPFSNSSLRWTGHVMFLLILLFILHILMSDILPLALCFSSTNAECYLMLSQKHTPLLFLSHIVFIRLSKPLEPKARYISTLGPLVCQ